MGVPVITEYSRIADCESMYCGDRVDVIDFIVSVSCVVAQKDTAIEGVDSRCLGQDAILDHDNYLHNINMVGKYLGTYLLLVYNAIGSALMSSVDLDSDKPFNATAEHQDGEEADPDQSLEEDVFDPRTLGQEFVHPQQSRQSSKVSFLP